MDDLDQAKLKKSYQECENLRKVALESVSEHWNDVVIQELQAELEELTGLLDSKEQAEHWNDVVGEVGDTSSKKASSPEQAPAESLGAPAPEPAGNGTSANALVACADHGVNVIAVAENDPLPLCAKWTLQGTTDSSYG